MGTRYSLGEVVNMEGARYMITADEYVKRMIAIWGEDHVDELLDSGYVPTLLSNGEWVFKLETPEVTANVR
jgi:hypothetical protein